MINCNVITVFQEGRRIKASWRFL